jgi:hypothetical protein
MTPYDRERDLEEAAHQRGEISANELSKRLREIDREEYDDAQRDAQDAYERTMMDRGF